ncbi:MAG: phosphatidylinositol-specific phospholipase C1-like protein [Acidimicrobiia bacterium]
MRSEVGSTPTPSRDCAGPRRRGRPVPLGCHVVFWAAGTVPCEAQGPCQWLTSGRAMALKRVFCVVVISVLGAAVIGTAAQARATSHPAPSCRPWTDPTAAASPNSALGVGSSTLADRCLHLNHLQAVGSHNSYHVEPGPQLFAALRSFNAALAASIEYTHSPLFTQFAQEGIRQIELDVFADPEGGLYDTRIVHSILGLPTDSGVPELEEPGFKVLHVQEIDFETRCYTLVQCLVDVRTWSDTNPSHAPLAILIELKDDPIPDPLNLGFVAPHAIGGAELDALDGEIRSVFSEDRIITPDDVRGSAATLEHAVLAHKWPTLGEARGQVMFLMDNAGSFRTDYLAGHPSLAGRVLFTNSSPGQPDAAFVKRNDPTGPNLAEIQALVRAGYVVRTRADADTVQARTSDTSQRDAAFASGAQWVSTDYPVPGRSARFGSDYFVDLPGPEAVRCDPINTGPLCRDAAIERSR